MGCLYSDMIFLSAIACQSIHVQILKQLKLQTIPLFKCIIIKKKVTIKI